MFGLMTVARHEREMALAAEDARAFHNATLLDVRERDRNAYRHASEDRDGWRTLAMKLAADLADLQRRYAPMPLPDDLAPGEGSVGDGDAEWTPTALAARAKAVR